MPKTRAGGTWTEAKFFSFIRSNLRLMSRKWPPIQEALKKARRAYRGPNRLQKWEYKCDECGGWFLRKHVEAEHIIPCGSLKSFGDVQGFLERMLVEADGIGVKCKACHKRKTGEERRARSKKAE